MTDTTTHAEHDIGPKQYVMIGLLLAAITAAEVALSYIDVGPVFLPTMLALMVAKFAIVVGYYMHLKFDARIFKQVFITGLVLVVIIFLLALAAIGIFEPGGGVVNPTGA